MPNFDLWCGLTFCCGLVWDDGVCLGFVVGLYVVVAMRAWGCLPPFGVTFDLCVVSMMFAVWWFGVWVELLLLVVVGGLVVLCSCIVS